MRPVDRWTIHHGLALEPGGPRIAGFDRPFSREMVVGGLYQCYSSYRDLYVQTGERDYLDKALEYLTMIAGDPDLILKVTSS